MDKIQNLYSGPVTVQGANFQSHYVPAEKPYAVYAYVWQGPFPAIAQLIGTMLTGKVNEEGKMEYDGKAVYRMPTKRFMMEHHHCFIPEDMGELECEPVHLGFVGDTVGLPELAQAVEVALEYSNYSDVKCLLDDMRMAGLKVELGDHCKMQSISGTFDVDPIQPKKNNYFFIVKKEIALRVKIWDYDKECESPHKVLSELWRQIEDWQEVGVAFEHIKMIARDAYYQNQIDELLELAKLYGKYEKKAIDHSQLYRLLACREAIGKGQCFYDDFVKGMKEAWFPDYNGYDKDLEEAIKQGLVKRDGDIIQFPPDIDRMVAWKWEWREEDLEYHLR